MNYLLKLFKLTDNKPCKLRIITQLKGSRQVDVSYLDMTNFESAVKIGTNIARRGITVDVLSQDNNFLTHIEV